MSKRKRNSRPEKDVVETNQPVSRMSLDRMIGYPLTDVRYDSHGRRGTPNILIHKAGFCPLHRFITGGGAVSVVMPYGAGDMNDWKVFWSKFEDILYSGTGSRPSGIITEEAFMSYLQSANELASIIASLFALKSVCDLDWEGNFGESRPAELRFLSDWNNLSDSAFDVTYGDRLREAMKITLPIAFVNYIYGFHSPYTIETQHAIHLNSVMPQFQVATNAAALITAEIDTYLTTLGSSANRQISQTLHNFTSSVPIIGSTEVIPDSPVHANGLKNCQYGGATNLNQSIFEMDARGVCKRNTFFGADDKLFVSAGANVFEAPFIFTSVQLNVEVYTRAGEVSLRNMLFAPFYEQTAVGVDEIVCYNHGLTNYDGTFTLDALATAVDVVSCPGIQGNVTTVHDDVSEMFDLGRYLALPNRVQGSLYNFGDPAVSRERIIGEEDRVTLVGYDAVYGHVFEIFISDVTDSLSLDRLSALTQMSGVRPARPGVK